MVDLFAASRCMKHCRVNRKIDESCCFDLYADDDGRFLLGCTMNKNMKGKLLLTTIENSHTMDYEQLCLDAPNDKRVKAVVSRDWLTELVFTLHDKDHDCKICDITFESRVFSAAPIAFRLAIHSSDSSDIRDNMGSSRPPRQRAKSATGVFGDLTCFSDTSCMELTDGSRDSDDEDERSSECRRPNASQYSTVDAASSGDLGTVFLRTRAPIWNTELRQWLHNFGGRVRSPTFRCFVVVEDGAETVASTLTQNKVLIRHGRVSEHSFVLDFRCPVSPLVALATMCAAQASKTYVHI